MTTPSRCVTRDRRRCVLLGLLAVVGVGVAGWCYLHGRDPQMTFEEALGDEYFESAEYLQLMYPPESSREALDRLELASG